MDSFEINKILGAVLATCLGILSLNIVAGQIFAAHPPAKPGYAIAVKEAAPDKPAEPEAVDDPIGVRLAQADIKRGEAAARPCAACHTFDKGGRNLVGPNLWGVVGRTKAALPGFNFSAALRKAGEGGARWNWEELDSYLRNPRAAVPGTTMSFAGVSRAAARADLILFLNSHSDTPLELPKAADAGPASLRHAGVAPR